MNSDYVLVSRWALAVSRDDVWDALEELLASDDPMAWWPSVQVVEYDGSVMSVRASSGLGYAVRFSLADLETRRPISLRFTAAGDLLGCGVVTFDDVGPTSCAVTVDWRVATDRRWMRCTAWLLRPVFVTGHRLVMRQGERHLNHWLGESR